MILPDMTSGEGKNHQKPAPSEAKALNLAHLGTDNLRATAQELGIDPLDCPGPGREFGDHHAPLEDWASQSFGRFGKCLDHSYCHSYYINHVQKAA